MENLAKYTNTFTGFVEWAPWIYPAVGILFVFLCIVSKGFRNFILGLIILTILVFEGFWFYSHFYSSDEERAEFNKKVGEVFEGKKPEDVLAPTPMSTPVRYLLKDRKL